MRINFQSWHQFWRQFWPGTLTKMGALSICLLQTLIIWPAVLVSGQAPITGPAKVDESVELLIKYLRIDTTNPPGDELRAARFFGEIFQREDIEYRVFESAPGRGCVWARLRGDGTRRPVILLNHLDVVPADPRFWTVPPFDGEIRNGFIIGRGALDMKSLAIAQLMTLIHLRRERAPLVRDLIFIGTADEESGGKLGAEWFVRTHPELLGGAEYLLTEGGGNVVEGDGQVLAVGLSPGEKAPAWLQLTALGQAGHASVPRADSAVNRLIRALNRLLDWSPPLKVTLVVEQYFRSLAPLLPAADASRFTELRRSIADPEFRKRLESDPAARTLFQNTIAVTRLEGGNKVNVIPAEASAQIDTRLLPGEGLEQWIKELSRVVDDDHVSIKPLLAFEPIDSPVNTELAEIVRKEVGRRHPGAILTYPVTAGFTDSHYFRRKGIHSYGLSPFIAPPGQLGEGYHGHDERIGAKAFTNGVLFLRSIIEPLVSQR